MIFVNHMIVSVSKHTVCGINTHFKSIVSVVSILLVSNRPSLVPSVFAFSVVIISYTKDNGFTQIVSCIVIN